MAAKTIYCYTIYDNLKDEEILTRGTLQEASDKLGIPKDKIIDYARKKYAYNRRFEIVQERLDGKENESPEPSVDPEFQKEWDEVCLMINPKARG